MYPDKIVDNAMVSSASAISATASNLLKNIKSPLVVAAALFIAIPYAPNGLLLLADNIVVRATLIAACVSLLYVDMLLGIFVFMLVSRIFLERNHRKLLEAKAVIQNNSPRVDIVLPDGGGEVKPVGSKGVDRVVHPPEDTTEDYVSYLTHDDNGESFHAIPDSSIDGKRVLPVATEGAEAATKVFADTHPQKDISDNSAS